MHDKVVGGTGQFILCFILKYAVILSFKVNSILMYKKITWKFMMLHTSDIVWYFC